MNEKRNLSRNILLNILVILGNAFIPVWADQPPSATDSEAFQKLRKIVKSQQFFFEGIFARLPGEADFCQGFMGALKAGTQIRAVEPYYRTDDLDDPALESWRECGANPNINEGLQYYPATGTRGFRLYKVDADNNPRSGLEDVLYSEFDFKDVAGPAGFAWWDLKTCKSRGGASAQQDDKREKDGKGELGDNYALLIKYLNKIWALTMVGQGGHVMKSPDDKWTPPTNYYLMLSSLHRKPELPRRTHYACSWSTMRSSVSDKPTAKSAQ